MSSPSLAGKTYGTKTYILLLLSIQRFPNILVDLIDKTVTVVLVVVILRLIPQRLYRNFRLELWMQSTAAKEDVEDSDFSEKSRKMSLRIKALVVVTVSMASISLIAGDICMRVYHKSIVRDRTEMAQSIARIAAYDIDGDMTEQYLNRGHKADGYTETEEQLADILNSSENIAYLYVYKPMADGFHVVFDIDTPDVYGELMGNVVPYNEEIKDCKPFFLRGEEVNSVIYNSKYGKLLTVYQRVFDIVVINNGNTVKPDDIPKIVSETLYTDRMESDIKNIQISRTRSDTTRGLEIKKHLTMMFHSMSLPGADLIWHCPYIVIFSSDNGYVGGKDYREYALIKLYGENEVKDEYAQNSITMKKNINFISWDVWKESNRRGIECEVHIERKGNCIITATENLGIEIENTTTIKDMPEKIYAAITGDQVALTDIRFRRTEA